MQALCLVIGLGVVGCLTTPEAVQPRQGEGTNWATTFEKVDWLSEWAPKEKGRFGLNNLSVQENAREGRFLRVLYYKGGASPSASRRAQVKEGGGQFLSQLPHGPVDRLFLRYRVRFPGGFAFVKGGKLPGLYGGTQISGGNLPDGTNGFSTRFMWRTDGQGEVYVYSPNSQRFGTSLGRGSWHFEPGKWHCLEQELVLNTPQMANGIVRVWLDSAAVYQTELLLFRTVAQLKIEGVFFSTFFGGGDPSWAPPEDTQVDFSDFATGPARIGCAQ